MFKPLKMSEVELVLLARDVERVSSMLYDLGIVELKTLRHEDLDAYDHADLGELSKQLLDIRSTITILKKYFTKETTQKRTEKDLLDKVRELNLQVSEVNKALLHLNDEKNRVQVQKALKVTPQELEKKSNTFGYLPLSKRKSLKLLSKNKIVYRVYKTKERIYFIAKSKDIPFVFTPYYLPKTHEKGIAKKITQEEKKLSELQWKLEKLANANLEYLRGEERKLAKEIDVIEAKNHFGKTKNITVMQGFLPKKQTGKLQRVLEREVGEKFELHMKDAKEDAPVELEHGKSASNFEQLLAMYSLPKYREFDPTSLMFLVFPLFYGFILGDVIYGLISLFFFTGLKAKMHSIKEFLSILQLSSISSIIFGIIYGEFMGFEFHGAFYGFFERGHHPETLLLMAVLFGLVHINLGVLLGFINNLNKSFMYGLYNNLSWFTLQIGIALIAFGVYSGTAALNIFGGLLIAMSVVFIYLGHGFAGVIEIPGFFTNILSYARLMAVGLSSIAIAILVNEYSVPLFSSGIIGIIGGIVLFTIGHIFNIFLGNFESFLHTLRLHYVEFFTKFYTGGGREFKPFGKK